MKCITAKAKKQHLQTYKKLKYWLYTHHLNHCDITKYIKDTKLNSSVVSVYACLTSLEKCHVDR